VEFQAEINILEHGFTVRWPKPEIMSLRFFCDVFVHELGHHFDEQYHHKNGLLAEHDTEN
jgi:hypothetical protein